MKRLVPLLLLLLAASAAFLAWAPGLFATREQAHADLLARERDLHRIERELGTPDLAERDALLAEYDALQARVASRFRALAGDGEAPPRLVDVLRDSPCEALRPGGALHEAVCTQAGVSTDAMATAGTATPAEQALARVALALAVVSGPVTLDTLELRARGELLPVPDLPGFRRVEIQLVVSGALTDLLATLELLAPAADGGVPQLSVQDVALRRIQPSRWGESLHRLESPPVRATATVDALFPPAESP